MARPASGQEATDGIPNGHAFSSDLNGITPIAGRGRLASHFRWLAWLVDPGFPGEPFVGRPADRAVSAREEHRAASKFFPIRFHTRRDRASGLGAFDHDDTHLGLLPVVLSCVRPPSAGLHLFSGALGPADPSRLQNHALRGLLQDSRKALLDGVGGFRRDFPGQLPEFLVLCRRGFEVSAAV
jgi:hypothetical protein